MRSALRRGLVTDGQPLVRRTVTLVAVTLPSTAWSLIPHRVPKRSEDPPEPGADVTVFGRGEHPDDRTVGR